MYNFRYRCMNMKYEKGKTIDACDNGIWLDYADGTWYFCIKDDIWTKEEIKRTKKAEFAVSYVNKGILDLFLISIFDCLETSDIPFSIKEADDDVLRSLDDAVSYEIAAVLIQGDGTICAVRREKLTKENSDTLRAYLKNNLETTYTPADFDNAYAINSMRYEPFEMEQYAVFTERFR